MELQTKTRSLFPKIECPCISFMLFERFIVKQIVAD